MCDPVSLMIGASAAVSGYGQFYAAQATAAAAEANAVIGDQNAIRSEEAARDAIRRGQMEEDRLRREGAQIIGAQEAGFAAANLDLSYGSPLDAIVATATAIELDALTIRENAAREADDLTMQAHNQRAGAIVGRAEARSAKAGGMFSSVGTVLSGGAQIYKYRATL